MPTIFVDSVRLCIFMQCVCLCVCVYKHVREIAKPVTRALVAGLVPSNCGIVVCFEQETPLSLFYTKIYNGGLFLTRKAAHPAITSTFTCFYA